LRIVVVDESQVDARCEGISVGAQSRKEVIARAARIFGGDAQRRGPGQSVGAGADDNVIASARWSKAAIWPGNVDGTVPIDCRRGQRGRAQVARHIVARETGDLDRFAPAGAPVVGNERSNVGDAPVWNGDHSTGQHQRLATKAAGLVCGGDRIRPGGAAIGGSAHHNEISLEDLVPLDVAIAKERAALVVVASNPWFVEGALTCRSSDWEVPVQAIAGTADENPRRPSDGQRHDEP